MRSKQAYQIYNHAAETLDHQRQILMLYDAAINYVKQAKDAIDRDDHNTRYIVIDKAMSIMRGLRVCLDFSACTEVAEAMDKYYDAIDRLMVAVQCHHDGNLCNIIVENLQVIRRELGRCETGD